MRFIEAKNIVRPLLVDIFKDDIKYIDIWDEYCIEFERGWVINYMTKEFINDPVNGIGLISHKPFLIDVIDMKVYELFFNINPIITYLEALSIYMYEKETCPDCELLPMVKKINNP